MIFSVPLRRLDVMNGIRALLFNKKKMQRPYGGRTSAFCRCNTGLMYAIFSASRNIHLPQCHFSEPFVARLEMRYGALHMWQLLCKRCVFSIRHKLSNGLQERRWHIVNVHWRQNDILCSEFKEESQRHDASGLQKVMKYNSATARETNMQHFNVVGEKNRAKFTHAP